jgi:hypothetical protein
VTASAAVIHVDGQKIDTMVSPEPELSGKHKSTDDGADDSEAVLEKRLAFEAWDGVPLQPATKAGLESAKNKYNLYADEQTKRNVPTKHLEDWTHAEMQSVAFLETSFAPFGSFLLDKQPDGSILKPGTILQYYSNAAGYLRWVCKYKMRKSVPGPLRPPYDGDMDTWVRLYSPGQRKNANYHY